MSISRDFNHRWECAGAKLRAVVSPCAWMYQGHGLQLTIDIEGGGQAIIHNRDLKFEDATELDALALCQQIKIIPCKCCGKPAFDPSTIITNREGKCEACWMDEWRKGWDAIQKKEAAKLLRNDRKQLKLGYTHRISAWIHPAQGGDDYQVDYYVEGKPSKTKIQSILKKEGSRVLDDYQVFSLEEVTKPKP